MFYWAAYFGNLNDQVKGTDEGKNLVDFFMGELGFTPFIGFYRDQSPVFATIAQKNLENFKYFVENTRHGLPLEYKHGP